MSKLPSHLARAAKEFSEIRRQQFLYWEAYEAILESLDKAYQDVHGFIAREVHIKYTLAYVAYYQGLFVDALDRISLEYTAGAPMEELKGLYPAAVDAFEQWCSADDERYLNDHPENRGNGLNTPLNCRDVDSYRELLRLISLGVLLGEGEQLCRIARLAQSQRQSRSDAIIEELLLPFVPDGREVDVLLHFDPYDDLIGAAWSDGEESAQCMLTFLKAWYKTFEGARWHNAHLRIGNYGHKDWATYYGYWAWEAGAMAYLYGLDDKAYRDQLIYPKDLVDWARQQGPVPKQYTPPAAPVLCAQPGQPCPQEGIWFAPHLQMKEVRMKQGETMPGEAIGPTGGVTWYFKGERSMSG